VNQGIDRLAKSSPATYRTELRAVDARDCAKISARADQSHSRGVSSHAHRGDVLLKTFLAQAAQHWGTTMWWLFVVELVRSG
jgi:hypothetical protein